MACSKRVLLFAPYFLPRRRVGAMRPFRFAIHLREFGWEPTVLTIAAPGQELTEKEARLLRDVSILNVEPPFDRTVASESQLGKTSRNAAASPGTLLAKVASTVDRQFPVDTWLLLFAAKYRTMARMVAEVDPHVIWATGDPWSGLVVGRWLSERLGTPFVADFRDPWTLSHVRTDGKWPLSHGIDRRAERRVVRSADVIMFQAQRVADAYRTHYESLGPTTVVIRNSFDPDVFDDPIRLDDGIRRERRGSAGSGELHLGFFGRFRAMSPATLIVDALAEMRAGYGSRVDRVFVHSFGPLSQDDAAYARARGVLDRFVARDAVPLEQSLSVLRAFDLLLVSTDIRRQRIIPAKIFEYLAAGRPILSLSRNPEVAELLDRTGTGVQMHDTTAIAKLLADSVDALERGDLPPIPFHPRPDEIMKHEARASTRELARVFDRLIGHEPAVASVTE